MNEWMNERTSAWLREAVCSCINDEGICDRQFLAAFTKACPTNRPTDGQDRWEMKTHTKTSRLNLSFAPYKSWDLFDKNCFPRFEISFTFFFITWFMFTIKAGLPELGEIHDIQYSSFPEESNRRTDLTQTRLDSPTMRSQKRKLPRNLAAVSVLRVVKQARWNKDAF